MVTVRRASVSSWPRAARLSEPRIMKLLITQSSASRYGSRHYGFHWRNLEQTIHLIDNETIELSAMLDASFDVNHPTAALETFLNSETCKPVLLSNYVGN